MDHASAQSSLEWRYEDRRTLFACSLVCRKWRDHAQTHLSKPIEVAYEGNTLWKDQHLRSRITSLKIVKKSKTDPVSPFAIHHQLPRLSYLNIEELDLTREHQWLARAPLFRYVKTLILYALRSCQLLHLIRFINTFPCLSRLEFSFCFNKLEHKGGALPKPSYPDIRSLNWIQLDLQPGISKLISWFLQAKPLLAQLKTLILFVWNIKDEDEFQPSFEGVGTLLEYCRNSIVDLKLYLDRVPMVENISELGQYSSESRKI